MRTPVGKCFQKTRVLRRFPTQRDLINKKLVCAVPLATTAAFGLYACGGSDTHDINAVRNVVVIYAENRSFNNLYDNFPGANGLQNVPAASAQQLDRDGTVLKMLPTI